MTSHLKRQKADDIPQKLTDADYAYDLVLFVNTSAQAESLQAARGIGLYVAADKTVHLF